MHYLPIARGYRQSTKYVELLVTKIGVFYKDKEQQ